MSNKKSIFIVALAFALILSVAGVAACQAVPEASSNTNGNPQQLQLLNTGYTFTQEQTLSRIQADKLIKNGGYLDSDSIVALITLGGDALIDSFNANGDYDSVAEYAASMRGSHLVQDIHSAQNDVIAKLKKDGLITSVKSRYSTLLNAIAVETTYGKLSAIGGIVGSDNVSITETYNLPQATSSSSSAVSNVVDIYPTGIYNSASVIGQDGTQYTGKGTAVAILDSGFDCSHEVFQRTPEGELVFTKDTIAAFLNKQSAQDDQKDILNAVKNTAGITIDDVYYSAKIPFAYDYADKDVDVFPYDSEHGTHVAGIIGGASITAAGEEALDFTGVAVDTQLVLMKVFPDLDSGGKTEDILEALEDAVLLGVDAINMSLGSSCGFSRLKDGDPVNEVYDKIKEAGISLLTAASNSYSSGYGGDQGNTNFVTNPDSGTVGAPSTYDAALSVASISGVKSNYIVANKGADDESIFFYNQSNSVTGDANDFVKELKEAGYLPNGTATLEYVTVPGVGLKGNYTDVDVSGKIALIKRGDNSFEDKAMLAKRNGAIACIIYNNVDGDILMSMGKTAHIPTISVSKDVGTALAKRASGTLTISESNLAGPFMSDFSSWGPTPDLKLKPEITAHGGDIYSSVPNAKYDRLSGTSMATPNLCGVMVLIREYLKDKYPEYSSAEINEIANQMLMSTATVALNEEGVPYSPRKQGAGLASAGNVVQTNAYLTVNETVDGVTSVKSKSKIELGDDAKRTGVYTMEINVVNISTKPLTYNLSVIGMSESVSTSDATHVAETGHLLDGKTEISYVSGNGSVKGSSVTVEAGKSVSVSIAYTLTQEDKDYIDQRFLYGMYVEGFVCLTADNEVPLNVPFLAFYGDWTEAPLFDKTYYEVEEDAHDQAIDDEDKTKADYWATTPYGSYYYNYMIPLGTYLYTIDESKYDAIPASEDRIAVSNILGAIDGISAVYAGMLRNAKAVKFTITDKTTGEPVTLYNYETGETMMEYIDYDATKAYYNGTPYPYFEYLRWKSLRLGLVNNHVYEFKMQAMLDYGDGGLYTNARNTFSFDFTMDDQAPLITDATYEKVYDKSLKKDRYYINLTVYDNHYVMSIAPLVFTSDSSYTFLTENPIPVYGEKNSETTVRIEITDYLEDLFADEIITSALAFSVDDYALNSNIFLCQLPGTNGELKFTQDGTPDGESKIILSMYEGEVADITNFLSTTDSNVDADKDYLKYLTWSTSNDKIISVKDGVVMGLTAGKATVTATENLTGNQAVMIVNVKAREDKSTEGIIGDASDAQLKSLRFSYFDTVFAYSRAAQTSEIGATGDRKFLQSMNGVSMYPGEQIKLFYDLDPWYAEDNYNLTYISDNTDVAIVDENGKITALKEGFAQITLRAEGSAIQATVQITVKSEFVIENRVLVAYKGLGGNVVIPDDEGILYIGSYAFCLYTTDNSIELSDDDYDANKIPATNTTVTSVVIPEGVTEIQKYAFYNCKGLREVAIPKELKIIREYAFFNCSKLERIVCLDTVAKTGSEVMADKYKLENGKFVFSVATAPQSLTGTEVETIGRQAFYKCKTLDNLDLSNVYAVGDKAFDGCESLSSVNLTALRNTGVQAFQNCTNLSQIVFDPNGNTKLGYAMFANSGLTEVTLVNRDVIPTFCFANSLKLTSVTIATDSLGVGTGAFSGCEALTDVTFNGTVAYLGEQAFYKATALEQITLPNCEVEIDAYAFYRSGLTTLGFAENTRLTSINGPLFRKTNLSAFTVDKNNSFYSTKDGMLVSKDGKEIVLSPMVTSKNVVISADIERIGQAAFAGTDVEMITFEGKIAVGDYAFVNCQALTTVTFADELGSTIGIRAFNYVVENSDNAQDRSVLSTVNNLDKVTSVGDYAFSSTAITSVTTAADSTYGEGVFYRCTALESATLGAGSSYGMGCFQNCSKMSEVTLHEDGGITIGQGCFAYDKSLETVNNIGVLTVIPREAFFTCSSLAIAKLTSATEIGAYAFADCAALRFVEIPVVQTIGTSAFGRYEGTAPTFTQITLPSTLTSLEQGAFFQCGGLKEVKIPNGITSIPEYAFTLCTALQKVVLSDTVTTIQPYAFMGCSALTDINLGNVELIDTQAFYSCTALESVDFSSLKKAGEGAFSTTALSGTIDAPELIEIVEYAFQKTAFTGFNAPKLQVLGEGAFNDNTALTEFAFTNNIERVDDFVFLGCTALTQLLYDNGTTKTTTAQINDYAKVKDGVLYTKLPNGYYTLASVPAAKPDETLIVEEGTRRVSAFAGNYNKNITYICLPDSMRSIGFYAFYGCEGITTVEFRSVTAPAMDDYYDSNASLAETDKGYAVLHPVYNLFGFELYYYNFIDLVGKREPINMIVPKNKDISGYDSPLYEAYFGKLSDIDASSRTYEATEQAMIDFVDGARQILALDRVTLADDKLISNTVFNYRLVTQDPFARGYSLAEWDNLVNVTMQAKDELFALKAAKASQKVKAVQAVIDALPSNFAVSAIEQLKQVSQLIKALDSDDRALLDQTNYNALLAQYNEYCNQIEQEAAELRPAVEGVDAAQALAVAVCAVALTAMLKRKGA